MSVSGGGVGVRLESELPLGIGARQTWFRSQFYHLIAG